MCVRVLLYYAEFRAFIAREVDVVLLFEFFDYSLLCVADVRPFPLRLQFFKGDLKFVVDPLELSFEFVFRFVFVDLSGLWIGKEVWRLKSSFSKVFPSYLVGQLIETLC